MNIPQYFNPQKLRIDKVYQEKADRGTNHRLLAADPEGDQLTLTKWVEDTGATAMMPDTRFTVSYNPKSQGPGEPRTFGSEEAYALYRGLDQAQRDLEPTADVDLFSAGMLIADLGARAGAGGALGGALGGGF